MTSLAVDIRYRGSDKAGFRDKLLSENPEDEESGIYEDEDEDGEAASPRQHHHHHHHHQRDAKRAENYKVEIVRKLIANFDLEKTLNRYRNIDGKDVVLKPGDLSLTAQYHARRVGKQLQDLVGSDVIRLNDQHYAKRLAEQTLKQQQAEMEKKERKRMESERQRMRRLLSEGVITAQELQEEGFSETQRVGGNRKSPSRISGTGSPWKDQCKSAGPARRKKISPRSAATSRSKSAPLPSNSRQRHQPMREGVSYGWRSSPQSRDQYRKSPMTSRTALSRVCSFSAESQISRMTESEASETQTRRESPITESEALSSWEEIRGDKLRLSSRVRHRNRLSAPKPDDPLLRELWEEETVDGLYRIADHLIPPGRPKIDAPKPRLVEAPKPKQKGLSLPSYTARR